MIRKYEDALEDEADLIKTDDDEVSESEDAAKDT